MEEDKEEGETGVLVEELLRAGRVSAADVRRLRDAGYKSAEAVSCATLRQLTSVKGISERKALLLHQAASELVSPAGDRSAKHPILPITTGSHQLDALLSTSHLDVSTKVVEVMGEPLSGITQLCHQLCVTCQLPLSRGGADGMAFYIDTENTFKPERLSTITKRFGLNAQEVVEKVSYAHADDLEQLMTLLEHVEALLHDGRCYAVLVVDSPYSLLNTKQAARGELSFRIGRLVSVLHSLRRLAEMYPLAVMVTRSALPEEPTGQNRPIAGSRIMPPSTVMLQRVDAGGVCRAWNDTGEAHLVVGDDGISDLPCCFSSTRSDFP